MATFEFKSARMVAEATVAATTPGHLGAAEAAVCAALGVPIDTPTEGPVVVLKTDRGAAGGVAGLDENTKVVQHSAWEGVANGVAVLDATGKIVGSQLPTGMNADMVDGYHASPDYAPDTPQVPVTGQDGKLANNWLKTGAGNGLDADTVDSYNASAFEKGINKGAANGYASLDASTKVVEDPASASVAAAANKIPKANAQGKIDVAFVPQGSESTLDADKLDGAHASATAGAAGIIPITGEDGKIATGFYSGAGDADTVDGFHASQTPGGNKVAVADETGKLAIGWLPTGVGGLLDADTVDGVHAAALQLRSEKGQPSGYASLGATGVVPVEQLPSGAGSLVDADTLDTYHAASFQLRSEKAVANGYASLGADGKVPAAQLPDSGSGDADTVDGEHAAAFEHVTNKGAASGYASLNSSSKVVQEPASATATPTADSVVKSDGTGKIAMGWLPSGVDKPCVILNRTGSTQVCQEGGMTYLEFNNELVDSHGMHDNSVNPERATVAAGEGGPYLAMLSGCLYGVAGEQVKVALLGMNAAPVATNIGTFAADGTFYFSLFGMNNLNAGSYCRAVVYNQSLVHDIEHRITSVSLAMMRAR